MMGKTTDTTDLKPIHWIGSSKDELIAFPVPVRKTMGYSLYLAQLGEKSDDAKPLKGFGGAGVLEIVEDDRSGTYRSVYTVKFSGVVYVLHAFQKKSRKGVATPKQEIDLIKQRLKIAAEHYQENYEGE